MAPHSDRAVLEESLADASEAIAYLQASQKPQVAGRGAAIRVRFDSIPDIAAAIPLIRMEGAVLEPQQILNLTRLLEQAGEIRAVLNLASPNYGRLGARAGAMIDARPLLRELQGKILPDATVADDASV